MTTRFSPFLLGLIMLTGIVSCSTIVKKDAPSIAHIHIGHAITAWPLTPKKQGLLVVAELAGIEAAANSEYLLKAAQAGDMDKAKKYLEAIVQSVDSTLAGTSEEESFGLRKAAAQAIVHLKLASETDDASINVQRTITQTNVRARAIIDKADELTVFLDAGLQSQSIEEMEIIAEEIARTLDSVAGGPGNDDYGLYELREDIEQMVARETPAYKTVDSWYLFNLVKLPSGDWGFSSRNSRGAAGLGY